MPWSAGVVIPFLGEGVSAHNFQKTLYRQPAFDTTYAVSHIITV
ncbi:ribulokinase [Bifidobacterium longum]|nr:ribulokinase [Bifidobacterium longum]RHJ33789.1 ribulokinase [Bifidobacterium longum]